MARNRDNREDRKRRKKDRYGEIIGEEYDNYVDEEEKAKAKAPENTSKKMWTKAMVLTVILILFGFGAVVVSLFKWQVIHGEELKSAALDQSLQSTSLTSMRGTIYDSTGDKILAKSAQVWTVIMESVFIEEEDRHIISKGLSAILDLDEQELYEQTGTDSYYIVLKRRVETEVRDEIREFMKINKISSGIRMTTDYKRYYPYGSVASAVLGFTGNDNVGLEGIESQYDSELRGTAGRMISSKNALGKDMPFQYEQFIKAEEGYDLVLTIDETVQNIVERHLEEGIERFAVENGAVAIVMDVNTGAIQALASKGGYDPNDPFTVFDTNKLEEINALPEAERDEEYAAELYRQWRNKAVNDTYYPGSVFKMCVGSMGLEEGLINESTPYTCTGNVEVEGVEKGINCWYKSGHGELNFREGLCNSCNPYFIYIGRLLGPTKFFKYFEGFGLTERTGIDLPGESGSLYYTANQLNPSELATESMGQNFAITPIQMVTAIATVANGGNLVRPHVVDRILDSDGNIVETADEAYKRQVISKDTSERISDILKDNTDSGSADQGAVVGYSISGKTGTSEKVAKFEEDKRELGESEAVMQYIASYGGYAPSENPQYALLVFFDEPQKDKNGGFNGGNAVAGPIFSDIMAEILPYLGVKSQYTEEQYQQLDAVAPSVIGMTVQEAIGVIEASGLNYEIVGNEDNMSAIVALQAPTVGDSLKKSGKVVIYTEGNEDEGNVYMPEFVGYSLDEAEYYASEAGIQLRVGSGSSSSNAQVSMQSIEAGTLVKRGTVVMINFADNIITETFGEG